MRSAGLEGSVVLGKGRLSHRRATGQGPPPLKHLGRGMWPLGILMPRQSHRRIQVLGCLDLKHRHILPRNAQSANYHLPISHSPKPRLHFPALYLDSIFIKKARGHPWPACLQPSGQGRSFYSAELQLGGEGWRLGSRPAVVDGDDPEPRLLPQEGA